MVKFAHESAAELKIIGKVVIDDNAYTAIKLPEKDIIELNGHKFLLLSPEQVEAWRMMLEFWDENTLTLLDRRSTETRRMLAKRFAAEE